MFLKILIEQRHTLAFRLTLWYGAIFTISSLLVFLVFYHFAALHLYKLTDTDIKEEIREFSQIFNSKGLDALKIEIINENESENTEEMFIRLLGFDGSEIITTDLYSWKNIDINKDFLSQIFHKHTQIFETRSIPRKKYDVRIVYAIISPDIAVQFGSLLKNQTRIMSVFKKVFGITMTVVLFMAALSGWFMAKQALSGVEDITHTARQISEGAFGQRVPGKNRGREIEKMAQMFNYMLDNIQKVISEMKEMTDNIAHDLKSPITRIRGVAEVTLTKTRSVKEYEQMAASTIEECDYLLEMINTMLDISETEAGAGELDFQIMDMADMVRDICDLFEPLLEKKGLKLTIDVPQTLPLTADIKKIQRLMANLLDNAVKYTHAPGTISVSLFKDVKGDIVLSVSDNGIGIAETDLPHIFERFYRCDRSRSKTGSGLGLCLVKAIVKSHGGDINVFSQPGQGSRFEVKLPEQSNISFNP